jgi:hypothetical protein
MEYQHLFTVILSLQDDFPDQKVAANWNKHIKVREKKLFSFCVNLGAVFVSHDLIVSAVPLSKSNI